MAVTGSMAGNLERTKRGIFGESHDAWQAPPVHVHDHVRTVHVPVPQPFPVVKIKHIHHDHVRTVHVPQVIVKKVIERVPEVGFKHPVSNNIFIRFEEFNFHNFKIEQS